MAAPFSRSTQGLGVTTETRRKLTTRYLLKLILCGSLDGFNIWRAHGSSAYFIQGVPGDSFLFSLVHPEAYAHIGNRPSGDAGPGSQYEGQDQRGRNG